MLHLLTGALFECAASLVPRSAERYFLADSKPIALCKPIRHGRVRLLREEGACFGKSSAG